MPNQIMDGGGRQSFAQGAINWNSDTIKAVLVDTTYTFSASHANLSDVGSGARIATATLSGNTSTNGILNSNSPITWTGVTNSNQLTGFYIYKDTGTASTSTLIAWIDGLITVTIAAGATSATVTVDPLRGAISNSAVLTRTSGSGPSTITLSGSGGGAANARSLTSSTSITTVTGDTYTVATSGSNFPIASGLSSATINYNIDSGTNKLFKL